MNAHAPKTARLSDVDVILAVIETAARAEAEIEAAYRFKEGSDAREWHLERADQATVELLGLVNRNPDVWAYIVSLAKPLSEPAAKVVKLVAEGCPA